jgi:DNA-binding NarL/FixJ family response regulator
VSTKVIIVDDHPTFRSTARLLLESEGFEVIGEAPDGMTAIVVVSQLHPDLVLLDVNLPDIDGFDVASRITAGLDAPHVVLTSSRDSSDFGPLVHRSGARGFIPKGELSGAALSDLIS